jgi:hypothetical protein
VTVLAGFLLLSRVSSGLHLVVAVLLVRPTRQVLWPHTPPVVAQVTQDLTVRDWAMMLAVNEDSHSDQTP